MEKSLPPTVLVVFGISGDLSRRYLLPALNQICVSGDLPPDFKIVGISRRDISLDEVYGKNLQSLKRYSQMFTMDLGKSEDYAALSARLHDMTKTSRAEIIFYLAVPPVGVLPIIRNLGKARLNGSHIKLLLEKPFGTDLESARSLIEETAKYFKDEQIYRIDHYLAKEMAQNITVFLGSNSIIRGVWDNRFVSSIDIVVAEKIDIEGRAGFYEGTGALRDVGQSHLLQLAALTLMEPCSDIFDFEEIPRRRLAALKSLNPVIKEDFHTSRAQYEGYAEEVGNPGSLTETFFDITLQSSDPRWQGVPVRLVSGKALSKKLTEIRVHFKEVSQDSSDLLVLRIQPHEGIELYLWIKEPGYSRRLQKLPLSFTYDQHFGRVPDAYEQVLIDATSSNHSLFASNGEVLESWRILQPILDRWGMNSSPLPIYKKGSSLERVADSPL